MFRRAEKISWARVDDELYGKVGKRLLFCIDLRNEKVVGMRFFDEGTVFFHQVSNMNSAKTTARKLLNNKVKKLQLDLIELSRP